ncbi:hypothetical protein [Salinifilum aidingensis]
MPEPFVAYLRVYEPVSALDESQRERAVTALERGAVDPADAGTVEQRLWLRTQLTMPPQLLPGAGAREPVLALDAAEVPSGPSATVGPGPLVCPLDLRGRAAAALVGFLGSAEQPLRAAALPVSPEQAKARASAVVNELSDSVVHILSSTWSIPLPWFALVDPDERRVAPREGRRRVYWHTAMADARRRVARAHSVCEQSLGEEGPTRVLKETGKWLEHFHPHSAVELDYGGLVRMMPDEVVEADSSAEDVHAILDAMEAGDSDEVSERYEQLRDFWAEYAARERRN